MYTEENEFNYDDYLDSENDYNSNKSFFNFGFIFKILLIIILIVLIIFLVFKIKNKNKNNDYPIKEDTNSVVLLSDNINLIRDASRVYFFQNDFLPSNIGEKKSVRVTDLIEQKLIISIKDNNGNNCGYNSSGSEILKNKNDYQMNVHLACESAQETGEKTFYYDLNGKCLNCNGEDYTSNNDVVTEDDENEQEENNNNDDNDTIDDSLNNNDNNNVCGEYSDWTTEEKDDINLDKETRVLVKAFKNEVIYGEWSEPSINPIASSDNLEVKTYDTTEQQTSKTCSNESTSKPSSKEGREITSRVETKSSTKKVCTGGKTYTKKLKKWDNNAYSCKYYGIGNVVCTYKTKKTCTNKKTTYNVTYYSYCDTVTKDVTRTYYSSRSINYNPIYTDYILESEIPEGYKKVDGSELIQYRYREKCGK